MSQAEHILKDPKDLNLCQPYDLSEKNATPNYHSKSVDFSTLVIQTPDVETKKNEVDTNEIKSKDGS